MNAIYLLLLTATVTLLVQTCHGKSCKRRVCYFTNYSQQRNFPEHNFFPEDIDPSLCTHVVYHAAVLKNNTLVPFKDNDESTDLLVGGYEKVIKFKKCSKHLLVLLSLHAFNCDGEPFLSMGSSKTSRKTFVSNAIKFLRKHRFDGLVFHCIYGNYANMNSEFLYRPSAKTALSDVVSDLRLAFNKEATGSKRLLLVLAAVGEMLTNDTYYAIPELSENVDWIHLMAFTMHEMWRNTTGHHSPLYPSDAKKGAISSLSVDTVVKHWINRGAPKDKLVLTLSSFGVGFELTSSNNSIGAPSTYYTERTTSDIGIHGYFEICQMKANSSKVPFYEDNQKVCTLGADSETNVKYILEQRAPYLITGRRWIGYDDVMSLWLKTRYLKEQKLGGFAFFSLDLDGFRGWFCGQGRYPLLKTVNAACLR